MQKERCFEVGVPLYSLHSQKGIQEALGRARCQNASVEPAGGGAMPKYLKPAPDAEVIAMRPCSLFVSRSVA